MTEQMRIAETRYRLARCILVQLEKDEVITPRELEIIRDTLVELYNPPIGFLEKGLHYDREKSNTGFVP